MEGNRVVELEAQFPSPEAILCNTSLSLINYLVLSHPGALSLCRTYFRIYVSMFGRHCFSSPSLFYAFLPESVSSCAPFWSPMIGPDWLQDL